MIRLFAIYARALAVALLELPGQVRDVCRVVPSWGGGVELTGHVFLHAASLCNGRTSLGCHASPTTWTGGAAAMWWLLGVGG